MTGQNATERHVRACDHLLVMFIGQSVNCGMEEGENIILVGTWNLSITCFGSFVDWHEKWLPCE